MLDSNTKNFRSYLKIGKPKLNNIMGLFRDRYELIHSEYALFQDIDQQGQAISEVKGGTIQIALPCVPTEKLLSWILDPNRTENGEIVLYDGREVIDKLYFDEARCVSFRLHYEPFGPSSVITQLSINARRIETANIEYSNPWRKNQ